MNALRVGLCRKRSKLLYEAVQDPAWHYHLRSISVGAQITGESRYRAGVSCTDECFWCGEPETVEHRLWRCPRWKEVRQQWACGLNADSLPDALRLYGLVPLHMTISSATILCLHAMYLHIALLASQEEVHARAHEHRIALPAPDMLADWLQHPTVRNLKLEPHMQLPTLEEWRAARPYVHMLRDEGEVPCAIGPHMVVQTDAHHTRCVRCDRAYAKVMVARYVHSKCIPDAPRPATARPPPKPAYVQQQWKYVRHAGMRHVLEVSGRVIVCKRCGAQWNWQQRFRLANKPCRGSVAAHQAWRRDVDEMLPILYNHHVPALHHSRDHLMCLGCGWEVPSLSLRSFDKRVCVRAHGNILATATKTPGTRMKVSYTSVLDSFSRTLAKCRGCGMVVPWARRTLLGKRHVCVSTCT